MKQSTHQWLACATLIAVSLGFSGCANWSAQEDLPVSEIRHLQASGALLPFNLLNADVLALHPGGQVEHAALDKIGDRLLYQASVSDSNKMQWFVELDARNGQTVTDKQDPH